MMVCSDQNDDPREVLFMLGIEVFRIWHTQPGQTLATIQEPMFFQLLYMI